MHGVEGVEEGSHIHISGGPSEAGSVNTVCSCYGGDLPRGCLIPPEQEGDGGVAEEPETAAALEDAVEEQGEEGMI